VNNLDSASDKDYKNARKIIFGQLVMEIEASEDAKGAILLVLNNGGRSALLWKRLTPSLIVQKLFSGHIWNPGH